MSTTCPWRNGSDTKGLLDAKGMWTIEMEWLFAIVEIKGRKKVWERYHYLYGGLKQPYVDNDKNDDGAATHLSWSRCKWYRSTWTEISSTKKEWIDTKQDDARVIKESRGLSESELVHVKQALTVFVNWSVLETWQWNVVWAFSGVYWSIVNSGWRRMAAFRVIGNH